MIVVVTALIGPAESPPPVGPAEPGVRYVCVTDRSALGWEVQAPPEGMPRRAARRVKTHVDTLFPDAAWSIWIDASFDLVATPSVVIAAAKDTGQDVAAFAHPDRTSVEAEAVEVMRLGLADPAAVDRQMMHHRRCSYPERGSLTTTGLIVRRHCAAVARFNRLWWSEITSHTLRDQLSVDFAAWRAGFRVGHMPGSYRDNAFARYNRQRHRQGRVAA